MKKDKFLKGAMISTIGIIVTKIIGVLYVIPFYEMIGQQGGNLYGYAYSIYAIFLSLSIGGIPVAMSKLISEYSAVDYQYTKEKTYKIGTIVISAIGFISFILMMIFAPFIAKQIIGSATGGNSIESVTLVIRIISSALLVVPILSVTKGYFQGNDMMAPASASSIIEQIVRVAIILIGSYTVLNIFDLSVDTAVGISVFAATVGAFVAYFYLIAKRKKHKKELNINAEIKEEEKAITTKKIVSQILKYAIPFIIIDLLRAAYSMVDTFTVVKTLTDLGVNTITAENALSVISVWGSKLNQIVTSIAIGFTLSLIPSLAGSYKTNNMKEVNKKINQSLSTIAFLVIPMVLGLFILARPIWVLFYSFDQISINIYAVFVFQALTFSFYSILIDIAQTLNNTVLSLGTLIGSLLLKLIINRPLMNLFSNIGIPPYFAPGIATIVTQLIAVVVILVILNKKYKINYKDTFKKLSKTLLATLVMSLVLYLLTFVYPIIAITKFKSIICIIIYAIIGIIVFGIVAIKTKLLDDIFGKDFIDNILIKLKIKKKV